MRTEHARVVALPGGCRIQVVVAHVASCISEGDFRAGAGFVRARHTDFCGVCIHYAVDKEMFIDAKI
jgi:hypothetical protein